VAVRVPPQVAAQAGAGAHGIEFRVERLEGGAAEHGEPGENGREAGRTLREKSTFMVPR
jgi:hypothetical protein